MPIRLLPLSQRLTIEDVLSAVTAVRESGGEIGRQFLVADTYVQSSEDWTPTPWGWETEVEGVRIINVDHHAPVARMERPISSGNLAIEYVQARGTNAADWVLINHCDCDSVISSSILAGDVEPSDALAEAVLAADHTGAENWIADHLQPLEANRDLVLSQQTLRQLIADQPVAPSVQALWAGRVAERQSWAQQIHQPDVIQWIDIIALIETDQRIPAELLTGLLPQASLIVTAYPAPSDTSSGLDGGRWITKIRLGQAAAGKFTLESLGIRQFDAAFGGRWNAGSNNRGGGTVLSPPEYVGRLAERVAAADNVSGP